MAEPQRPNPTTPTYPFGVAAGEIVERPDLEARRVTYRIAAEPCTCERRP